MFPFLLALLFISKTLYMKTSKTPDKMYAYFTEKALLRQSLLRELKKKQIFYVNKYIYIYLYI